MNIIDNSGKGIAALGRDEDRMMAHVASGEMVVPPVISESTKAIIRKEMQAAGLDPNEYQVGQGMSINPITGMAEFGFLKKLAKTVKKVVKKIAPIAAAIPGPWQGPAIMYNRGRAVLNIAKGEGGIGDLITAFTPAKSYTGGKTGNIFGNAKDFITKGSDGVGLFGNIGKGISNLKDTAGDFIFKGTDDTNLFGNIGKGISKGYEYVMPGSDETGLFGNLQKDYASAKEYNELTDGDSLLDNDYGVQPSSLSDYLKRKMLPQSVEDALNSENREGGMFGGMFSGKGGAAGIAALIAKLAYDDAKNFKGVPLTPLTTTDQLGRYNIAAESARQAGTAMPNRTEFGLNPSTLPRLVGGKPRGAAQGGIMAFAQGGAVAMANGGEIPIDPANFPVMNGQIDGPGTETSDDIPAMLSDGEFVMTAKAVKGAGGYNVDDSNGILTLSPNGEPSRDSGTRVMYKLMEHFGGVA